MRRLHYCSRLNYTTINKGWADNLPVKIRGYVSAWVAQKGLYTHMKRSALAISHSLVRKSTLAVGMVFAVTALASPASASSAATTSDSFRISPQDVKANETALGLSDPDFRALHKNWGGAGTAIKTVVAIPSINPVETMMLSSSFGYRRAPTRGASRNHKGLDIPGPVGTPIFATADGIVGRAQWVRGYGKYVELEHGNAIETRYGHMSALNVSAGQRIRKGDIIGFMGSTGRSTGSHLHYEVRIGGEAVNPASFLASTNSSTSQAKVLLASQQVDTTAIGGPAN
jgi:murein DD-endopeptidase MepM/ murein hydrolase activator NlpD